MTTSTRVLVYGATGHTGQFVVQELLRRGIAPVLSGRDAARLDELSRAHAGLERRVAALDDAEALRRAVEGIDIVVGCAGPFLDTGLPLASAAVAAGAHYLDMTAEQPAVQQLYRELDGPARAAGVAVVPAMAFYGGLADLMVTRALAGADAADEVEVAIGLDRWWPTAGTRLTGERNTAVRQRISGGELVPLTAPARSGSWTFPEPLGEQPVVELTFSEAITLHRHLRVGELTSYLSSRSLAELRDESTPPPEGTDDSGRSAQRFVVDVTVRRGDTTTRVHAAGRDIYAVTAPVLAEGVQRLLTEGPREVGAVAPAQAFDATDVLAALAAHEEGLTIGSETSVDGRVSA